MTTPDTNSPTPNQGEIEHSNASKLENGNNEALPSQSDELTALLERFHLDAQGDLPYADNVAEAVAAITAQVHEAEARGRREFAQKLASSKNWRVDLEAALQDTTGEGKK